MSKLEIGALDALTQTLLTAILVDDIDLRQCYIVMKKHQGMATEHSRVRVI